ncbi:MAG: hypothetical protein HN368_09875 [Spirochaetales bacterium]|jgi:hypothetical protein|nr:hypothetical protein [Spirochaetales bacterium]
MIDRTKSWLTLDNAAKLYPAIRTENLPMVFRISATLKERVKAEALQTAVDNIIDRFPYYKVSLRAGFFWYYLEGNSERLMVRPETDDPCHALPDKDGKGYMLRVQAYKNRISVEFFHILTDGTGGLVFLKSLLCEYFRVLGNSVPAGNGIFSPGETPDPEEFEDAAVRYHTEEVPKPPRLKKAFRLPYPLRAIYRYTCLIGECSAGEVYKLAKKFGVSVTEYLGGVYLYTLQSIYSDLPDSKMKRKHTILRLQIPINLRKIYSSKTMRNFSLFVTPGIDTRLGTYTLEELVKIIHIYMETESSTKYLARQLSRNVNPQKSAFIRGIPLLIKNSLIYTNYTNWGPTQYSGVLTNLGRISMPDNIVDQIESFSFLPPPGRELRIHGGVATYGDTMQISFGNVTESRDLERRYFKFLVDSGIHVKINRYKDV